MYLSYLDNKYNLVYNVYMTSDYRVIRDSNNTVTFSVHEVFYDDNGVPIHMNKESISLSSDNLTTLTQKLIILISSLTKDVLDKESFNTDLSDSQNDALEIFKNV